MTTYTAQPDAAAGLDTTITASAAGNNFGVAIYFAAGADGTPNVWRALLKFDLSSIPAGATINSATITLRCIAEDNATDRTVGIHRALTEWYEGNGDGTGPGLGDASTWNFRNHVGAVAWSGGAGGGSGSDFAASATSSVSITGSGADFVFDVAADVQDIVNGGTNHGWWLINASEGSSQSRKLFASSDNATAGDRPEISVDYTAATGQPTSVRLAGVPFARMPGAGGARFGG